MLVREEIGGFKKKQLIFLIATLIMFVLLLINYQTEAHSTQKRFKTNLVPVTRRIQYRQYLGVFTIYAYCPCAKCCGKQTGITASGTKATEGRTVAADLPFGTVVEIEGIGERIVEDRGVEGKVIDLFMDGHDEALKFGRKELRIRIKKL